VFLEDQLGIKVIGIQRRADDWRSRNTSKLGTFCKVACIVKFVIYFWFRNSRDFCTNLLGLSRLAKVLGNPRFGIWRPWDFWITVNNLARSFGIHV